MHDKTTLSYGDEVYFIAGDNKGTFGKYIKHDLDSGYCVPHIDTGLGAYDNRIMSRPWDREIINIDILKTQRINLLKELELVESQILMVKKAKNEN
jgi:hypothetical protein